MKLYLKKVMVITLSICILFSVPGLQLYAKAADLENEKSPEERQDEENFNPITNENPYEPSDNSDETQVPSTEKTTDETSDDTQSIEELPDDAQDIDKTLGVVQESQEEDQAEDRSVNMAVETLLEGSGTPESPYLIRTPEELDAIRHELSGYYQLQNDIDLWGYCVNGWKPIGDRKNPFTGTLDGNGYRIVGFEKLDGTGDTVFSDPVEPRGFFSCMSGGTIMNLGLVTENGKIFNGTAKSSTSGLLLGQGNGKIVNCYTIGDLESQKGTAVGLIVGEFSGSIERCWSKGSIKARDPWWGSEGRVSVGGIAGKADGEISECYSICNITAQVGSIVTQQTSYAGGIVGSKLNEKIKIRNCYFSGNLYTGDKTLERVGGIIACFEYDRPDLAQFDVTDCYFNSDTTYITSETDSNLVSKLGIPKTTNEMKDSSTYTGWDFENLWQIREYMNDGYPYFRNTEKIYVNRENIVISYEELFVDYPECMYNIVTKRIFNQAWEASAEAIGLYTGGDKDMWLAGQYILYEGLFEVVADAGMKWVVDSVSKYFNLTGLYYENYEDQIINQMAADVVSAFSENENFVKKAWGKVGKSFSTLKKLCNYGGKISKDELRDYIIELKKWDRESAEKMIESVNDKLDESLGSVNVVLDDGDRVLKALQTVTKVIWTMTLSEEATAEVKSKIPKNTDLYTGLDRLENRIKNPIGTGMQSIINDATHECATMIANNVKDAVLSLILGPEDVLIDQIIKIGKKLINKTIDASVYAKADDYVKALAYKGASTNIHGIFGGIQCRYAQYKVNGVHVETKQLAQDIIDYQNYFDLYVSSLNKELELMKGISKSDQNIVRRIEASQELIKDYDSEAHLKNSLRQAEKGWRLKYTERNGIVSIAGNADSDISTYSTQDIPEMSGNDILYIPGELNGNTVKNILPYAFAENPTVKIIVIGEGIEEIGEGAFADCPNLEHVLLPSSLQTIKAGAFANCEQITDIEMPESIESIDDRAFDNNDNLTIFAETNSAAADYAQNMQYELIGVESEIENIEISRYPDKVEFSSDEEIDLDGMELLVTYMNGEKETVSEGWIVLDSLLKEGSTEVQIQYKDKRLSIPISLDVKEYEYSIEYVDIDGNTLAEGKTGTALFGEEIVETSIDIEGYTALNETNSFIIGNKDNIFNIVYQKNEKINLEEGGSIDTISPQKETGAEITPDVVVKYNNQVLIKDEDYMTVYMDNVNAGNATVLVIGLNKYEGMLSGEFLIEKPYVKGDINTDSEINLLDLMQCLNHVAKKNSLEGNAFLAADIDENGKVDLFDLMRILNYVAKKTDTI